MERSASVAADAKNPRVAYYLASAVTRCSSSQCGSTDGTIGADGARVAVGGLRRCVAVGRSRRTRSQHARRARTGRDCERASLR
ncbi:hypothetical protein A8D95_35335 [Burkholderia cenocepacia]|uniref:Uncharacterized protein n=1 Tax=Burkholderia cenocepacia TaxID=95486 RepID=A0A1V2W3Q6_9BURK|nr:hypothetical protein A8E75_16400 [Burkholderia cenocepacia]AQQ44394.1 hypothetical protein A8F32_00355 [Burkholderia cenocepacia]ONJ04819.1 hypothetical protein A8D83_21275 [Burkholderia cenocepacia]ONJ14972.1 hypothetical protein A8F33_02175 [Burkholderia cenocepacia]ONJ31634.1 hypothetical protein A8F38_15230 [Burkholderia cenocepacia]